MPEADATPDVIWKDAILATVVISNPPPGIPANHVGIPIRVVKWTDADIQIWKENYPNGVVLLNELTYQQLHNNQITTSGDPKFNLDIVQHTTDHKNVNIIRNVGWPSGEIVIWTTQQPD